MVSVSGKVLDQLIAPISNSKTPVAKECSAGVSVKRRDATEFLKEVLDQLDELPPEFSRLLIERLKDEPRDKREVIRDTIREVTGD